MKAYHDRIEKLEGTIKALESKKDASSVRRRKDLQTELIILKRPSLPPDLAGAYAVTEGKPIDAALQRRGDPAQSGRRRPARPPSVRVPGRSAPSRCFVGGQRTARAGALAHEPDHPLTPRVMVNRIWQHHFGRGIVATPSNFGLRGEPPTHPELLDWLAARIRRLRLVDQGDPPRNPALPDLPARAISTRTTPNSIPTIAGSGVFRGSGSMPKRSATPCWPSPAHSTRIAPVPTHFRRSRPGTGRSTTHSRPSIPRTTAAVYLMTQRLVKHPYLAIFDGPDTNMSTEGRPRSTVPLQALYLMNNPFVQEQAAGLARRLIGRLGPDAADRDRLSTGLVAPPPPMRQKIGSGFCER